MKNRTILIVLACLAIFLFTACGAADSDHAMHEAPTSASEPEESEVFEAADFDAAPGTARIERAFEQEDSNYFRLPIVTPSEADDRRFVYTVSMRLQTTDFLPGVRTLLDTVAELGGELNSMEVQGRICDGKGVSAALFFVSAYRLKS